MPSNTQQVLQRPRRRKLLGTAVSIADYSEVLDCVDAAIVAGERIYVCCAPAHTLVTARVDQELHAALAGATIVTPDGMPVVWLARGLGEAINRRVYGPGLMLMQCERAARQGQRVWLYGGFNDDALAQLEAALTTQYPTLRIVGSWSPPHRPLTDDETAELIGRIEADRPDVIWIGLGSPKQEIWMHSHRHLISAPVILGVGAAFDFHSGRVSQAPRWMQKRGLEWFFRLIKEPRRLGPRYLSTNPRFIFLALVQLLRERWISR